VNLELFFSLVSYISIEKQRVYLRTECSAAFSSSSVTWFSLLKAKGVVGSGEKRSGQEPSCDCLGAIKIRAVLKEKILSLSNIAVLMSKSCQSSSLENPSRA